MFATIIRIIIFLCILAPFVAFSAIYPLPAPGNDIIGHVFTVKAKTGDTMSSLGLRYGMSLHEMTEANPGTDINTKLRAGKKVVIPAQFILPSFRAGIVINMAELRLYYFPPTGKYVLTYPVAMGRDEWRTPTIATKVVSKEKDPVWRVPESIRAYTLETKGEILPEEVPPGPENPLGHYALHLGAPGYLIHGNNAPASIGKFVSSGCIRMKNKDVETLFDIVPIGTPVYIIHYPYKAGWFNGQLFVEAQVPVELQENGNDLNQTSIQEVITAVLRITPGNVDWAAVESAAKKHLGVPVAVGISNNPQVLESHPPLAIHTMDGTGLELLSANEGNNTPEIKDTSSLNSNNQASSLDSNRENP